MTGEEAKERLKREYKYRNGYNQKNYDRISVFAPKGTRDRIKATGRTANGIITELLLNWLDEQEQHAAGRPEDLHQFKQPEAPPELDVLPDQLPPLEE